LRAPVRGRGEEFERVALVHLPALYSMALRLTRNPAEAEDLLQDTVLRAFRFFDRYQAGTNAKAWLFRILRNSFINRYRTAQRRPEEVDFAKIEEVLESVVALREPPGGLQGPEEGLLARSLDEPIQTALRSLPADYRVVLLLAVVEGFSYKEIAATVDIPIGTVMSRLHRARKQMQSRLVSYARERGLAPAPGAGRKPEAG
jgi:RNA polymerase sigma-70 factor, ECF subfamily